MNQIELSSLLEKFKKLIEVSRELCLTIDEGGKPNQNDLQAFRSAIYHAKTALKNESKSQSVPHCIKCGLPKNNHNRRHPFVGIGESTEKEIDPLTRNWLEDATHENGNYQNKCALCWNQFVGHKDRVVCKLCSDERPIDAMTMKAVMNQNYQVIEFDVKDSLEKEMADAKKLQSEGKSLHGPLVDPMKLIQQGYNAMNANALQVALRTALMAIESLIHEVRK